MADLRLSPRGSAASPQARDEQTRPATARQCREFRLETRDRQVLAQADLGQAAVVPERFGMDRRIQRPAPVAAGDPGSDAGTPAGGEDLLPPARGRRPL